MAKDKRLFNTDKLIGRIHEKHLNTSKVAEVIGRTINTTSLKVRGYADFSSTEILLLANRLDIDDVREYFLKPEN